MTFLPIKFQDSSVNLYINQYQILPIGEVELKINNVTKKIQFCTNSEFLPIDYEEFDIFGRYLSFIKTLDQLPLEQKNKTWKMLKKHSPRSSNVYNFSTICSKINRICCEDKNRDLNYVPLEQLEIDEITYAISSQETANNKQSLTYYLILYLQKNDALRTKIITNILSSFGLKKFKPQIFNEFATSCVYSTLLIETLLWGRLKTLEIEKKLKISLKCVSGMSLLSDQEYEYYFDVYAGMVISNLKHNPNLSSSREINSIAIPLINNFHNNFNEYCSKHLADLPENASYEKILEVFNMAVSAFPFNKPNLDNLIIELTENSWKVTEDKSFGYIVKLKDSFGNVYHAFFIEQFLRKSDNQTCHRIYQSWLGKAELKDDMKKKGYDEIGNVSFDLKYMIEFLKKIDVFFAHSEQREETLSQLFGYQAAVPVPTTFENNTIGNCDIVYWCEKIELNQIVDQLQELTRKIK